MNNYTVNETLLLLLLQPKLPCLYRPEDNEGRLLMFAPVVALVFV